MQPSFSLNKTVDVEDMETGVPGNEAQNAIGVNESSIDHVGDETLSNIGAAKEHDKTANMSALENLVRGLKPERDNDTGAILNIVSCKKRLRNFAVP